MIFTIAFCVCKSGIDISNSSNTDFEIETMEVPIAFPFKSFCAVGLLISHTKNSGKILLLKFSCKRITKNEVEATEGWFLFSYLAAKFFVPLAANKTSPCLSKCFSVMLSCFRSG